MKSNPKSRSMLIGLGAIVLAWLLAWGGYRLSGHSKVTAAKVVAYQASLDWARLSAADRIKALKELATRLNGLLPDERQKWRLDLDWFAQLSEDEKSAFMDAFLPGEMRQALKMFEQWPKARQQAEIDRAMQELRDHAAGQNRGRNAIGGTNGPLFSPELEKKIKTMGLNTLYSKGSAQTRADLAPLLLEVQRQFESGQLDLNGF